MSVDDDMKRFIGCQVNLKPLAVREKILHLKKQFLFLKNVELHG